MQMQEPGGYKIHPENSEKWIEDRCGVSQPAPTPGSSIAVTCKAKAGQKSAAYGKQRHQTKPNDSNAGRGNKLTDEPRVGKKQRTRKMLKGYRGPKHLLLPSQSVAIGVPTQGDERYAGNSAWLRKGRR